MTARVLITTAEAVTPVGLTAATTAAAVRAGLRRVVADDRYLDVEGNPLPVGILPDSEGFLEPLDRVGPAAVQCLRRLVRMRKAGHDRGRPCHLLLGTSVPERGGALYEAPDDLLPVALAAELAPLSSAPSVEVFAHGNASALFAMERAIQRVTRDSRCLCIVGAMDSLLDEELLERLEDEQRLKTEVEPCPHGLSPGEGAGFVVVESAKVRPRELPLAVVESVVVGQEPHPYYSPEPSLGQELTRVCRQAIANASVVRDEIDRLILDLDGEHHRATEWSYVDARCLGVRGRPRTLVHPAGQYGTVGAASAVLLMTLVAASRGWLDGISLVVASDDEGPRGAALLHRRWAGG